MDGLTGGWECLFTLSRRFCTMPQSCPASSVVELRVRVRMRLRMRLRLRLRLTCIAGYEQLSYGTPPSDPQISSR